MSSPVPDSPPDLISVRQLANAIRFIFYAVVLGLSSVAIVLCMSISDFEGIFKDMLNGKPLPLVTQFLLMGRPFLVAASFLVPVGATATLLSRRVVLSLYILGVLGFVAIAESAFLYAGLFAPLVGILKEMGGPGLDVR